MYTGACVYVYQKPRGARSVCLLRRARGLVFLPILVAPSVYLSDSRDLMLCASDSARKREREREREGERAGGRERGQERESESENA